MDCKMSAEGACVGAIVSGPLGHYACRGICPYRSVDGYRIIAVIISNWAIQWKNKSSIDDTLDVFPSHGVGGIVGMILTAVFAKDVGLVYGETQTFLYHLLALAMTAVFAFGGSYLLFKLVDSLLSMRVREDQEERGLDLSQHGESME